MPKRTDISTILIIGAGPIIIGQACEFDYSGTQAVKTLRAEGYRIVLVNSNPATIMTDPDMADRTYIEPITPEVVAKIIAKERYAIPGGFALLPTMGGQTALNCALSLKKMGVLEQYDVEMIGATAEAIDKAEDRERFREAMTKIGLSTPRSHHVKTLSAALGALDDIGLPAIIRPSFTLGGTGGGIAYNKTEFIDIVERGIDASPTSEVLVEESVLGWKEFEMEVVRDKADNCIIICSIENIDPMGVHTGDSITIAPALTLTDKEYQIMRNASLAVLREIGVETGGSNVQFAINPENGQMVVIEMNPRVSRSSAFGLEGDRLPHRQGRRQARRRLSARRDRQRHHRRRDAGLVRADHRLYRHQDSALRVREISRRRSRADHRDEIGRRGDGDRPHLRRSRCRRRCARWRPGSPASTRSRSRASARATTPMRCAPPSARRRRTGCSKVAQALRLGMSVAEAHEVTKIDPWFLDRLADIIALEARVRAHGLPADAGNLRALKAAGFSDARLAALTRRDEAEVRAAREALGRQAGLQAHRHLRRRVRLAHGLYVLDLRSPVRRSARVRGGAFRQAQDRHPRRRAEPHRPGHRVRLLLLPRLFRADRGRLRDHHDQLQSGDGLDRLRHLRPALFRAADRRGRARHPRQGARERQRWSASSCSSAARRR